MRWQGRRQSANIEDRRGMRPGKRTMVGGGCGMLILIIVIALLGGDPLQFISSLPQQPDQTAVQGQAPGNDEVRQFISTVLADTEDVWTTLFRQAGSEYRPPRLVLFSGSTPMPGGVATTASGPFYLPLNQTVYLDFAFFEQMRQRFGMQGDFAVAYVIAHEVGHHVQHLLGITDQVHRQKGRISEKQYNELSVRLELQADYLAGVWAHHAQKRWNILEEGDIEEAINAASTVGDDNIQAKTSGRIVPDAFTHGTSKQRIRWFVMGLRSGDPNAGDTFSVAYSQL